MNVLFTSVGRRVELLRAFNEAYRELCISGTTIGVDIDPLAPALQEVGRSYIVPRLSDPSYIQTLAAICRREDVALIIPLVDRDIPVLARHRGELEATGARLLLVPDEAVAITADKLRTYQFFGQVGVPVPCSWSAEEARRAPLEYPVVVKPRFGSAGENVVRVRNQRELDFFLGYVPHPVVQECLPGPEITNDILCDLEGNVVAVVSRQRLEVRWGEVAKGKTIRDPQIIRHCVAIAKGLRAVGPITIQCMLKDGTPYFTEVNPRFGGGVPLGFAAGVRSPHWLLALAAGRPVDIPPLGTYQTDLYLTRFDDSLLMTGEDRDRVASRRL